MAWNTSRYTFSLYPIPQRHSHTLTRARTQSTLLPVVPEDSTLWSSALNDKLRTPLSITVPRVPHAPQLQSPQVNAMGHLNPGAQTKEAPPEPILPAEATGVPYQVSSEKFKPAESPPVGLLSPQATSAPYQVEQKTTMPTISEQMLIPPSSIRVTPTTLSLTLPHGNAAARMTAPSTAIETTWGTFCPARQYLTVGGGGYLGARGALVTVPLSRPLLKMPQTTLLYANAPGGTRATTSPLQDHHQLPVTAPTPFHPFLSPLQQNRERYAPHKMQSHPPSSSLFTQTAPALSRVNTVPNLHQESSAAAVEQQDCWEGELTDKPMYRASSMPWLPRAEFRCSCVPEVHLCSRCATEAANNWLALPSASAPARPRNFARPVVDPPSAIPPAPIVKFIGRSTTVSHAGSLSPAPPSVIPPSPLVKFINRSTTSSHTGSQSPTPATAIPPSPLVKFINRSTTVSHTGSQSPNPSTVTLPENYAAHFRPHEANDRHIQLPPTPPATLSVEVRSPLIPKTSQYTRLRVDNREMAACNVESAQAVQDALKAKDATTDVVRVQRHTSHGWVHIRCSEVDMSTFEKCEQAEDVADGWVKAYVCFAGSTMQLWKSPGDKAGGGRCLSWFNMCRSQKCVIDKGKYGDGNNAFIHVVRIFFRTGSFEIRVSSKEEALRYQHQIEQLMMIVKMDAPPNVQQQVLSALLVRISTILSQIYGNLDCTKLTPQGAFEPIVENALSGVLKEIFELYRADGALRLPALLEDMAMVQMRRLRVRPTPENIREIERYELFILRAKDYAAEICSGYVECTKNTFVDTVAPAVLCATILSHCASTQKVPTSRVSRWTGGWSSASPNFSLR